MSIMFLCKFFESILSENEKYEQFTRIMKKKQHYKNSSMRVKVNKLHELCRTLNCRKIQRFLEAKSDGPMLE
jgi:hypothetical protein